jgi:chitinase
LQQTYKITGVTLNWETASAKTYQIQVSNDAIDWTTVYSTVNGDGGTDDIIDLAAIGRFVRMYGITKNHPEYGYSLWEFAVFGSSLSENPYGGSRSTIPGIIEAENYDTGGEGVAFHDSTVGNAGSMYRSDDVDIQNTTDAGAGFNVCSITTGEWLKYSVFIPNPGFYTLEMRVARLTTGNTNLHVECDGNDITGSMTVPSTGGWQSWTTIKKTGIYLNTINQIIKLCCDGNDFNVNWIKFSLDPTKNPSLADNKKIIFYPNPVTENLHITFNNCGNTNYTITNVAGKVILKDTIAGNTANVDMRSIKSGIYFININGYEFGKIIKQ